MLPQRWQDTREVMSLLDPAAAAAAAAPALSAICSSLSLRSTTDELDRLRAATVPVSGSDAAAAPTAADEDEDEEEEDEDEEEDAATNRSSASFLEPPRSIVTRVNAGNVPG
jgi:hypothetical protein